uniref:L-type lectin-like domain-containing protein n=1 Tax=Caenorhabditis tropicalis TaxID=1561998 RepID=A0A1I7V1B2_9PELO
MQFHEYDNAYRSKWDEMTTFKWIILIGGLFWAIFVLSFGLYNYCAIKRPPPAVSFDDALCAVRFLFFSI